MVSRKVPYLEALKKAIQQGELSPSALAWHEGQKSWTEVRNIPEIQTDLAQKDEPLLCAQPSSTLDPEQHQSQPDRDTSSGTEPTIKWYYFREM